VFSGQPLLQYKDIEVTDPYFKFKYSVSEYDLLENLYSAKLCNTRFSGFRDAHVNYLIAGRQGGNSTFAAMLLAYNLYMFPNKNLMYVGLCGKQVDALQKYCQFLLRDYNADIVSNTMRISGGTGKIRFYRDIQGIRGYDLSGLAIIDNARGDLFENHVGILPMIINGNTDFLFIDTPHGSIDSAYYKKLKELRNERINSNTGGLFFNLSTNYMRIGSDSIPTEDWNNTQDVYQMNIEANLNM
jgi:hypothetical protein